MQIRADASLQSCNTLALEAKSRALVQVADELELRAALAWARERELGVTVLGEGSNVVFAGDLDALVLRQAMRGIEILADDGAQGIVRVAAGENWHALVEWSLARGLHGLENLALIPGTAGAAPIQNIGAYGVELRTSVESVHALRIDTAEPISLSPEQCRFTYRDSIFKGELRDQVVITALDLRLSRQAPLQLSYPTLADALRGRSPGELTHRDVFDAVVDIRRSRLPDPARLPNAGSFFKNPVLEREQATRLRAEFPRLPIYPQADGRVKLPAAWLIDECGWKGHREAGVGVHEEHALVLVNYGGNSGQKLLELAGRIAASVQARFGLNLETEPRIYGGASE